MKKRLLKEKVKSGLRELDGIVNEKYATEELKENISDIIDINFYVLKIFFIPFTIFLLIYLMLLFLFNSHEVNKFITVIYSMLFITSILFNSILVTLSKLPRRLKEDIINISKLTKEVSSKIEEDLKKKNLKVSSVKVFQVTLLSVVLPIVKDIIIDRVFIIGYLVVKMVEKLFYTICLTLSKGEEESEPKKDGEKAEGEKDIAKGEGILEKVEVILDKVIFIVEKPFKFIWKTSLIISILFFGVFANIIL